MKGPGTVHAKPPSYAEIATTVRPSIHQSKRASHQLFSPARLQSERTTMAVIETEAGVRGATRTFIRSAPQERSDAQVHAQVRSADGLRHPLLRPGPFQRVGPLRRGTVSNPLRWPHPPHRGRTRKFPDPAQGQPHHRLSAHREGDAPGEE